MLYLVPTKRGMGAQIWGTHEDLNVLYEVIGKFWNKENNSGYSGYANRDKLISGFSYEIRKAKEGSRLKRKSSHFSLDESEYWGTQMSWVHILFSLTALKYNMRFSETNKFDISMILQFEFWLERAMNSYDPIGANNLIDFINDALYAANEYIYHYMRNINQSYFMLGGGKRAFRKLPELLRQGVYFTKEYESLKAFLESEGKRLDCSVNEMEIDDDNIIYDMDW